MMLKCTNSRDAFEAIVQFLWRLKQNLYEKQFITAAIKLVLVGIVKSATKGERQLYRTRTDRHNHNNKIFKNKPTVRLHSSLAKQKNRVKQMIKKQKLDMQV